MLVHLHVLALAPVALDELDLARHGVVEALGLALGTLVALDPLAVIGGVVAAEHGQAAVAELPDAGDGRVEERAVVAGDEERAGATPEMLLEPLDRPDVEVVRGLVEEHQVRVRDDEPGERRARLLAAGQGRRRPQPLVAGEAEAAQRLVHALVQRVPAEDVEAVLELGVVRAGGVPGMLELGRAPRPCARGAPRRGARRRAGPARP